MNPSEPEKCGDNSAYPDGRPVARLNLLAEDQGPVLPHGEGPGDCDRRGAREAILFREKGTYQLIYDGAGPGGWLACRASSSDLIEWHRHGPVLNLGAVGAGDEATASSPWGIHDGKGWHFFYLGSPNATAAPDFVPSFPYRTMKARARSIDAVWEKQYEVVPFRPGAADWCRLTASPGCIFERDGRFHQFVSGSSPTGGFDGHDSVNLPGGSVRRTLGLAHTDDLDGPWEVSPEPILPPEEQIENSSLYHEPENGLWFLFTNHVGCAEDGQGGIFDYTDAVWVYWSDDPLRWCAERKAIVLDGRNCGWSSRCIGMPSVLPVGGRLALLYDAPGGDSTSHVGRDIGLAWLQLPLRPPVTDPPLPT